jgi:hypothetical protein
MVAFRNAVAGTTKKLWRNENDQISFARGEKVFFAMTNDGHMDETLQTGLKSGVSKEITTHNSRKPVVISQHKSISHFVIFYCFVCYSLITMSLSIIVIKVEYVEMVGFVNTDGAL